MDNIRMDHKEIGINTNLVISAQDRNYWRALVKAALNLRIPKAIELVNMRLFFFLLLRVSLPSW